jgi:hypothetical protein
VSPACSIKAPRNAFTIVLTFGRVVRGEEAKKYQLLEEACLEGDRNMELMLYKMNGAAR